MEFSPLDPRAKLSWMLGRTGGVLFVLLVCVCAGFLLNGTGAPFLIFWICSAAVMLPLLINAYLFPFYQYRCHLYRIEDDRVEIIKGIVFRSHTVIPILRIQHVVVSAGPINRMLQLADVSIFTASGTHQIPELRRDEADRLCELLKDRVNSGLHAETERSS